MSRLTWLKDEALVEAVTELMRRSNDAIDNASDRIGKNVIDPFASIALAAATSPKNAKVLLKIQGMASASSGVSSAVGWFHQAILGSVDGFVNHDAGYDIECQSRKIIAEIKNKYNTLNAGNREQVEQDLKTAIKQKRGKWKAYLVIIIPKRLKRYKKKILNSQDVYEIDGASFYEMATGSETALHDLYDAVVDVVAEKYKINKAVLGHCKDILKDGIPA